MKESILFDEFWSHPNKLLENHIKNMISPGDEELDKQVKLYHDIAKLKNNFQIYIRDTSNDKLDKNHSLLSAYFFLLNSKFNEIPTLFGFLAIVSHHGDVLNLDRLVREDNKFLGDNFENSKELKYWDEVADAAKNIDLGQFAHELVLVALHETARDDQQRAAFFLLAKLQNRADTLLFGACDEAAGIYDHHVRTCRFIRDLVVLQASEHDLGVD